MFSVEENMFDVNLGEHILLSLLGQKTSHYNSKIYCITAHVAIAQCAIGYYSADGNSYGDEKCTKCPAMKTTTATGSTGCISKCW